MLKRHDNANAQAKCFETMTKKRTTSSCDLEGRFTKKRVSKDQKEEFEGLKEEMYNIHRQARDGEI